MDGQTEQLKKWSGDFGMAYTERNKSTDVDASYVEKYGVTRTAMNDEFLAGIDRDIRILEVGCNIGNQMVMLRQLGFPNIVGLEVSEYAFEVAKRRDDTRGCGFVLGSAFELPFKDAFFDIVYTSGVLIHISPQDIGRALSEIHRCSKKYIWGFEYYADAYQEIAYRGNAQLMWKGNFASMYTGMFPALSVVRKSQYSYLENNALVDEMFLLTK